MSEAGPSHSQIYAAVHDLCEEVNDVKDRLNSGSERFVEIDKKLTEIVEALKPIPQMQADIAATKEIVEAWGAIKTFGKFIKWFAGIVVGLAAIGASIIAALKFAVHLGK